MGYYIQTPNNFDKAIQICKLYPEAKIIPQPSSFENIDPSLELICIVRNFLFEATGFCYDEKEFRAFTEPTDDRSKVWLTLPRKLAEKLNGYSKEGGKQ